MKRLIDADELINDLSLLLEETQTKTGCSFCDDVSYGEVLSCIEVQDIEYENPTVDAVSVVRCKDCKHYLDGGCGNVDKQSPSKKLMGVKPNWFCADGERDINIPSKSDGGKRA